MDIHKLSQNPMKPQVVNALNIPMGHLSVPVAPQYRHVDFKLWDDLLICGIQVYGNS